MARKLLLISYFFLSASLAHAEERWSSDRSKEHPPASSENRIIKWCRDDGKHERFASANLDIKGYKPCGELQVPVNCDPAGQRMISKTGKPPEAYKDCGVGPRIVVKRTDGGTIEGDVSADSPDALTSRERADLNREMKHAEKEQEKSLEIQMGKALDNMVKAIMGANGMLGGSSAAPQLSDRQVQEMLRYVDPQSQPELKRLLQPNRRR